jgi:hypothetical protein
VRTAPTAPPRRRAGSVLTRCDSGDCITCPANASAHPRCSVMPRGANTVCPGGLRFGHHPSKHMAPHAAGALHERTQVCSRHADRQGHSGRTPHVNDDRVGEACVCLADSPRRTRMHSSCACGRASARTACGYAQLRAKRLRARAEAGTRTCMLQAACRPIYRFKKICEIVSNFANFANFLSFRNGQLPWSPEGGRATGEWAKIAGCARRELECVLNPS